MLSAYISGLAAYHQRSTVNGQKEGSKRPSLDGWDRAMKSAEYALAMFRKADDERRGGDVHSANTTVEEALFMLKDRCCFHSSVPFIVPNSVSVQEQFRLCTVRPSSWVVGMILRLRREPLLSFKLFSLSRWTWSVCNLSSSPDIYRHRLLVRSWNEVTVTVATRDRTPHIPALHDKGFRVLYGIRRDPVGDLCRRSKTHSHFPYLIAVTPASLVVLAGNSPVFQFVLSAEHLGHNFFAGDRAPLVTTFPAAAVLLRACRLRLFGLNSLVLGGCWCSVVHVLLSYSQNWHTLALKSVNLHLASSNMQNQVPLQRLLIIQIGTTALTLIPSHLH